MSALMTRRRAQSLADGIAALESDRADAAITACAPLLEADPADCDALLLLGLAHGLAGAAALAADLLERAHHASPKAPHPCLTLARMLRRFGRGDAVVGIYAAALAVAGDETALWEPLSDDLREAGDPAAAIDLLAPRLAQEAGDARAWLATGLALADLGRTAAALEAFRRATELAPGMAAAWSNLGMLLKVEGDFDAAIAAADRAVALAPDEPQIRLNRAVALLRAGRMAAAWGDYESRLHLPGRQLLPAERLLPELPTLGEAALQGRTVLVTHEEGFGDTLQFLRYAPLLAALGARVVVWVPAPLARLVDGAPGIDRVVTAGEPLPGYDYHCPVFSLPRAFATTLATIPPPLPYRPDAALIARRAAALPATGRRIGLAWAGQARPWLPGFAVLDGRRSLALDQLAPLGAVAGLRFVSLQMGDPAAQVARAPPALDLCDPMREVQDFADTAAVIANLDGVVSVDTAVVHLAASMGKPVLLLDRYDSCWRWFAGREDSPWYPTLRIFRQSALGDWPPVIARVARTLSDWEWPNGAGP